MIERKCIRKQRRKERGIEEEERKEGRGKFPLKTLRSDEISRITWSLKIFIGVGVGGIYLFS